MSDLVVIGRLDLSTWESDRVIGPNGELDDEHYTKRAHLIVDRRIKGRPPARLIVRDEVSPVDGVIGCGPSLHFEDMPMRYYLKKSTTAPGEYDLVRAESLED